tara:strand:+ start:1318 stop:5163 length:3846 start_codon:yes stop_codon:yes gene_type:complete
MADTLVLDEDEKRINEELLRPTNTSSINQSLGGASSVSNSDLDLSEEELAILKQDAIPPASVTKAINTQKAIQQDNTVVAFEDRPPEEKTQLSQRDIESSEEFVNNIKIYREARYGTKQTAGADLFQGLGGKGVLEATNINLVDDWLDNYRFVTGNEINALEERDFLQNLARKSETYKEKGDIDNFNKTQKVLQASSMLYQDTERLAPIFGWDNTVGGVFSKKRFEGMSAAESASEIIDAVGGHIAAGFSSPSSILSLGASKFLFSGIRKKMIAGAITKPTAMQTTKAVVGSAATGATIDGAAAGYLDTVVQGTEIEAGVRKKYDQNRTLMAMGIGAVIGGGTSALGARQTIKMKPVLTKAEMENTVKKVDAERVAKAKKTIAKSKEEGKAIIKAYKEELTETYGEGAVKTDIKGGVIGIDRELIKKKGRELLNEQGITTEVSEPAVNYSMFQRTMGAVIDVFKLGKDKKTLKEFQIVKKGGTAKEFAEREKRVLKLFEPLKKGKSGKTKDNERISDRVFKIITSPDINLDIPYQILARYGVTSKEWGAMLFTQASRSGSELAYFGAAKKALQFANRTKTAQELYEEEAELGFGSAADRLIGTVTGGEVKTNIGKVLKKAEDTDAGSTFSSFFQRLNNIRRAGLVSGLVTAIRNNLAQFPRMGIDTLIHGIETIPIIGNPEKKFSVTSSLSQIKHTFYDPEQAVHMSNMLLELYPNQNARIWNQFMEVKGTSRRKNPHTETLSGVDPSSFTMPRAFAEKGITKTLDVWERVVFTFNVFNRWQESLYRRGALMADIERQLVDQGKDLNTIMKGGRFNEEVTEDMMAKAVDYSLEFTYGADPKLKLFRDLNTMITNSPFTLAMPFPRFMFKAIEMSFNYNVTGLAMGLFRTAFLTSGRIGKGKANTAGYRQLAEGIAGSSVLLPLGYMLRDPENGIAGSEWNKLKDGMGKEFDARVYGPIIVPYLFLGEYIHRIKRGVATFNMKEALEAFTGTNFRNVGSIQNVVTDIIGMNNLDEMNKWAAGAGRVLGDATVGFLQPILQTADFKSQSELKRDYREDPTYASGVEAFLGEFFVPMNRRIQPLLKTVDDYFDTDYENTDFPYTVDPRVTDIPERLIPILKVSFGATMNRVPPEHIMKLGQLGFTYKDFMSKSPYPSINRIADKQTAERVAEEMPSFLMNMYEVAEQEKVEKPDAVVAGFVDLYLKNIRKESLAEAMLKDEGSSNLAYLRRYRSLPARSRLAVVQRFEAIIRANPKEYPKGEIDYLDVNHLALMLDLGRNMDVR